MSETKVDSIDGVDFYAAIQAHVRWRLRLEAYIEGQGEELLDPEVVGSDGHCALGAWINGPGGKHFGNHPKFHELQQAHVCFHKQAGEVIRSADSGDNHKARELLKGEYAACSHKVKSHLARLGVASNK